MAALEIALGRDCDANFTVAWQLTTHAAINRLSIFDCANGYWLDQVVIGVSLLLFNSKISLSHHDANHRQTSGYFIQLINNT